MVNECFVLITHIRFQFEILFSKKKPTERELQMKCVVACNLGSYLKTDVGISTRRCMGALQFMMLSVIDGVLTIETEHSLALFSDAIMLSMNSSISL